MRTNTKLGAMLGCTLSKAHNLDLDAMQASCRARYPSAMSPSSDVKPGDKDFLRAEECVTEAMIADHAAEQAEFDACIRKFKK